MKNLLSKRILGAFFGLLVAGLTLPAMAASPITGQIEFVGGATLNGSLGSATAFSSIFGPGGTGGPQVSAGSTGTYALITPGTAATFSLFTFNPAPVGTWTLWSVSAGGNSYSFAVTSLSISAQNANFLDLEGTGTAHATGFADTAGTWSITDTGGGPTFTFGALTIVPEPSAAALLLLGLGAAALRKHQAR